MRKLKQRCVNWRKDVWSLNLRICQFLIFIPNLIFCIVILCLTEKPVLCYYYKERLQNCQKVLNHMISEHKNDNNMEQYGSTGIKLIIQGINSDVRSSEHDFTLVYIGPPCPLSMVASYLTVPHWHHNAKAMAPPCICFVSSSLLLVLVTHLYHCLLASSMIRHGPHHCLSLPQHSCHGRLLISLLFRPIVALPSYLFLHA